MFRLVLISTVLSVFLGCQSPKDHDFSSQNPPSNQIISASTNERIPEKGGDLHAAKGPRSFPSSLRAVPVVLIGEMHYFTPIESYEYLLSDFSKSPSGAVCMAVEFPKRTFSFEESLEELRTRAVTVRKSNSEAAKKMDRAFSVYSQINEIAKRNHIKVFGVENSDYYKLDLSVDERNKTIATNIEELIKKNICAKVLGIFGKSHLTLGLERKSTIKSLLGATGVSALTVNLQMTNEETIDPSYKSFAESKVSEASLDDFIWLHNQEISHIVRVLPFLPGEISVWQEFDYTLLLPMRLKPIVYR